MIVPPWWKIRRELRRIVDQALAIPTFLAEVAWFELHRWLSLGGGRCHAGGGRPGADVAIYVLYQPGGILASTIGTCRHLAENGYSVRVVSNAPLSQTDVARLAPYCHRVTERPNHGYDFGAYQFAVNALLSEGASLDNLLLLNDSVWFPTLAGCDLLDRLRASTADFAGPVLYRHRKARLTHLQSYMLHFRRTALESAAFARFWRTYRMSGSKRWTIRFGEMRLTSFLAEGGLQYEGLHDALSLPDAIDVLSDEDLSEVLRYEAQRDHRFAAESKTLAQSVQTRGGRARSLEFLQATGRKRYFLSNHPAIHLGLLRCSILKKDRSPEFQAQRRTILERGQAGWPGFDATIFDEIHAWGPPTRGEGNPRRYRADVALAEGGVE